MTYIRKITNKQRCGFRGPKLRYSVFRAEMNHKWEICHEAMVRELCADNGLVVEEQMIPDDRTPWEITYDYLRAQGYCRASRKKGQGCSTTPNQTNS